MIKAMLYILMSSALTVSATRAKDSVPFGPTFFKSLGSDLSTVSQAAADGKQYVEKDCLTLLQEITNYFLSNSRTIYLMYRNSGKSYNDFGRFNDCEAMPDFNYMMASISPKKKLSNPLSLGLCLPTVCKESDLNALKPYIMPTLNNELGWIFSDVKGLNLTNL